MEQGKIQIYTGRGKGKTTAAFGLCLRAAGHGFKVIVLQFQKGRICGEHIEAEKIGIPVFMCKEGRGSSGCESPCPLILHAADIFMNDSPDLLVLDEIMAALNHGCVSVDEIMKLIDSKPPGTELVMTGRNVPQKLIERADLVTSMEMLKHYFSEGVPAREGIEY